MKEGVTVDWDPVDRAVARLVDGVETGSRRAVLDAATDTAQIIRGGVPKLTGRLASTVGVVGEGDAAGVTYGGDLPYAARIERRDHTVADAVDDAARRFGDAERAVAEQEVARL